MWQLLTMAQARLVLDNWQLTTWCISWRSVLGTSL